MPKDIVIKAGDLEVKAVLNDSKSAKEVYDKLPIASRVSTWGEEIYFSIPVMADIEQDFSKEVVELGDLGYWPQGTAFCIFFGQTPISKPGKIKPATAVNVIGKVAGDPKVFKKIKDGETITLSK
ncbi:MAG: cyclophilin-like fold protein [Candidatus Omnitrophota bacterium]